MNVRIGRMDIRMRGAMDPDFGRSVANHVGSALAEAFRSDESLAPRIGARKLEQLSLESVRLRPGSSARELSLEIVRGILGRLQETNP